MSEFGQQSGFVLALRVPSRGVWAHSFLVCLLTCMPLYVHVVHVPHTTKHQRAPYFMYVDDSMHKHTQTLCQFFTRLQWSAATEPVLIVPALN